MWGISPCRLMPAVGNAKKNSNPTGAVRASMDCELRAPEAPVGGAGLNFREGPQQRWRLYGPSLEPLKAALGPALEAFPQVPQRPCIRSKCAVRS